MPMIDVYATTGTFADPHALAAECAAAVMRVEGVPDIPYFRTNTAAFVHDLAEGAVSDVDGDGRHVRVQVLTPVGTLDRAKQLAVVADLTRIVASAAGDPAIAERTWVLLTEAPDGGWGMAGHAHTAGDIVSGARAALGA
jgi:phenylpyruvate tautomerase PptA (4-oxalocrotonate tautomerase family)